LILVNGAGTFWPATLVRFTMRDGGIVLGQIADREPGDNQGGGSSYRIKVKRANRDIDTSDFIWFEESDVLEREDPADALVFERREWGDFFGAINKVKDGDSVIAEGPVEGLVVAISRLPEVHRLQERISSLEKNEIGKINDAQERLRVRA